MLVVFPQGGLMGRHANSTLEGFIHNLRKGRVSVNHHGKLLHCSSGSNGIGTFLNQIRGMQSNNVHRHNLSSAFVVQDLGNTIAFPFSQGLGVGPEVSLRFAQFPSFLFGTFNSVLFRRSHHGNFWMGKAGGRNGIVVDNVLASDNVFHGRNSLCGSGVSQHHFTIGITNAVHVGNDLAVFSTAGQDLHLFSDGHKPPVGFNTTFFQSHVLCVGNASRGDHAGIHFQCFNVLLGVGINHFDRHGFFSGNSGCDFGCKDGGSVVNGSIPNQESLSQLGNFAIKGGHYHGQGFDKSNFAAEGGVDIGEFQSNVSRSYNGHPFGHVGQF
mmetsp:Transcript_18038/g.49111  ORF Transcript_18038/g.49111 Transcript_18038/m.49111 type:complete len:326 (-) Transcript_18038:791-1768(-)